MTKPLLFSILLFVIALAMRFHALQDVSIWLDEDAQAQVGLNYAPWHGWKVFRGAAKHDQPPLDYFCTSVGIQLFGKSVFAIRFFPALFSSATVPVFFWAVFVAGGSLWAALLGSAILLFNPFLLIYAHEARPYSDALFMEACFFLALSLSLKRRRGFGWVGLAAFVFLLSLSMQPVIVIAGLGLGLLATQLLTKDVLIERRLCIAVASAAALVVLPFVVILKLAPYQIPHSHPPFDPAVFLQQVIAAADKIAKLWEIQRWPARFFCVAGFGLLGVQAIRRRAFDGVDALFLALTIALLLFPIFVQGLFLLRSDRPLEPRYLLATVPLFAFVTALAAAILERAAQAIPWSKWPTRALIVGSVAFLAIQLNSISSEAYAKAYIYHDDWKSVYTLFRDPENAGAIAYVWTFPEKEAWTPDGVVGAAFYYPEDKPRPVVIRSLWQEAQKVKQTDQIINDAAAHRNPPYVFFVTTKAWNVVNLPVEKLPPDLEAKEWKFCNMHVVRITNHGDLAQTLLKYFAAYRDLSLPAAAAEKLSAVLRRLSEVQGPTSRPRHPD